MIGADVVSFCYKTVSDAALHLVKCLVPLLFAPKKTLKCDILQWKILSSNLLLTVLDLENHDISFTEGRCCKLSHSCSPQSLAQDKKKKKKNRLGWKSVFLPQFPAPMSIKVRGTKEKLRMGGKEAKSRCRCDIFRIMPTACQHRVKCVFLPFPADVQVCL